jgi:hypothetical protein
VVFLGSSTFKFNLVREAQIKLQLKKKTDYRTENLEMIEIIEFIKIWAKHFYLKHFWHGEYSEQ